MFGSHKLGSSAPTWIGSGITVFYTLLALLTLSGIGEPAWVWTQPWITTLGMNLDFYLGDFQRSFIGLILLISGAVQLYAMAYFAGKKELRPLMGYLQVFTLAMIGVVASNNLFLTFLFWEITSLCSYLMVGLHHANPENARKASQGLMVTMLGGVGLLLGALFLQHFYGTVDIQQLRTSSWIEGWMSYTALGGIALACLTKSAQFPFHFWLPNAMAGPTPVSALLHSATMVKAGVYLLAMLAPLFSQTSVWGALLIPLGLTTVMVANFIGLKTTDLKKVFAATTLAALGILTALAGVGSSYALKGFAMYLIAHALYKAPLFLSAGLIESSYDSRALPEIRGAGRQLPLVGGFLLVSIASMLGLPPCIGFLAKEYTLKALWEHSPSVALIAMLALAGAVAVGVRVLWYLLAKAPAPNTIKPCAPSKLVAVSIPVLSSLLLVLFYPFTKGLLQQSAADLMASATTHYKFWEGVTPALLLSLGVLSLAYFLYHFCKWCAQKIPTFADSSYESAIAGMLQLAGYARKYLGDGRLHQQLTFMLLVIVIVTLFEVLLTLGNVSITGPDNYLSIFAFLLPMMIAASIYAACSKRIIHTLMAIGVIGVIMAVIFLWNSAPDLALTQLLTEILILFLLVGVILKKREFTEQKSSTLRLIVASAMGLITTLLVMKAQTLEWSQQTSMFYLENSYSAGFGKNVVNVILVDFRAIDTLGEITVLAIAALGVTAAFGAVRNRVKMPPLTNTAWMRYLFKVLMLIMVPLTLVTLYRGHNAPGGGFIAALLASIMIGLRLLVDKKSLRPRTLRLLSHRLIVIGLILALLPVFIPLLIGKPLMQGLWLHLGDFHLGTPLLFDLGVFCVVVGFVTQYLRHFVQPLTHATE